MQYLKVYVMSEGVKVEDSVARNEREGFLVAPAEVLPFAVQHRSEE